MKSVVPIQVLRKTTVHAVGGLALLALLFLFVGDGGGAAGAQNVPVPAIAQPLVPTTVSPGAAAFTLTVNGTGFVADSVVNWNGSPRATTFVTSDQLRAAILATDVASAGTGAITVTNADTPHPKVSGPVYFPVNTSVPQVNFTSVSYPTGTNPTGVDYVDVNNDGIPDLVICNDYDDTISVLLGNGDGTFQPQYTFPAYGFPYNIFTGDFNNDGIPDLVTVDKRQNAISVFLGKGDGTFQHYKNFNTQGNPLSLNTGDFNGDGNLDVVTVNANANSISVLLGKGDGTFQPAKNYQTNTAPNDVTVGDFNGDGIPDLAVADNVAKYVSVFLGNGDGTFQPRMDFPTGVAPNAIHTADLNKDGILDIITANANHTISILLGNGNGTFKPHTSIQAGSFPAYAIATYDFNNDGNVDIIVPELNDGTLTVFLGNGEGTFQSPTIYPVLMHPDAFTVADFNHDGRLDLAVADETSNMVTIVTQITTPITLMPSVLQFGHVVLGQNSSLMSTMTNVGSSPVTITGFSVGGQNAMFFSQNNNCPGTLKGGQSCVITATFSPQTVGVKTAMVSITDSPGTQTVTLIGQGVH